MGRVRHPIYYSNSGEVKCSYRPKKGINIARYCVNGYSITAAHANSLTHVSFCWWVYRAHSNGGEYATRPVAWATGSVKFSVRGYEVPSEPSEPSGTPGCFRLKLGLLLMSSSFVTSCKDNVRQWNQSRDHNAENKGLDGHQMGDLDDNDEMQSTCGRFWILNRSCQFSSLNKQGGSAMHPAWHLYQNWMDYRCECFIHLPATSDVLVAAELTISALSSDCFKLRISSFNENWRWASRSINTHPHITDRQYLDGIDHSFSRLPGWGVNLTPKQHPTLQQIIHTYCSHPMSLLQENRSTMPSW
jgi:hypothetical protein